jgi:hypothetical protein
MNTPRLLKKPVVPHSEGTGAAICAGQIAKKTNKNNDVPDVLWFESTPFMRVRACAQVHFSAIFNRLMDTPPRHTGTSGTSLFLFRKNEKSGGTWKGTQP